MRCHWMPSAPELHAAATVKAAAPSATTLVLAGCSVMVSTGASGVMVSVAGVLVALPVATTVTLALCPSVTPRLTVVG